MKTKLLILLASAALTTPAFAHEAKGEKPDCRPPGPMDDGCEKLKLTDEQKDLLQAEHLKNEDARIDLEAKMRHAHVELEKAMTSKEANDDSIMKAAQALSEAESKLHTSDELAHLQSFLKVFKGKQRDEAMRCGFLHHGPGPMHGPGGPRGPGMDDRDDHRGPPPSKHGEQDERD